MIYYSLHINIESCKPVRIYADNLTFYDVDDVQHSLLSDSRNPVYQTVFIKFFSTLFDSAIQDQLQVVLSMMQTFHDGMLHVRPH